MTKLRVTALLVAVLFTALAGCSENGTVGPTKDSRMTAGTFGLWVKTIGPSDIILCVDVSDTVSAEGLKSMVDALGATLTDPTLVPQDGRIYVGAYVYGDTIAEIVKPGTPVTAATLKDSIGPALTGLLDDRIVSGVTTKLEWALDAAATALGASTVEDQHVFVIGSGVADDEGAVKDKCDGFAQAGVMVSTVGVGEGPFELFEECAAKTGGFFGSGTDDLDEVVADAFAYMLQVDIDLKPENAELKRGEEFTATAVAFRGGDPDMYPLVGQEITISVVEGPNTGESVTAAADTNGAVSLTYIGDGGPGTDVVVGETIHTGTGAVLTDTSWVEWINTPPTCDAGGPYDVTVTEDTAEVTLDGTGSDDVDGDSLRYTWTVKCEDDASFDDPTSATPVLSITGECLCVDSFTVELTVSDGYDETSCETVVRIDDMRPPVVEVKEDPLRMWPPNHKYHDFTPGMFVEKAEDACGNPIDISVAVSVVKVTSDEPEDDKGDGKTMNDIQVTCPSTVHLRAERAGGRTGRVYTITYRVTGENGVSTDVEAKVVVPHDNSGKKVIEDEDGGYTYTPDCDGDN
ncbi:MAG: VWA domain-containing protein [Candidatus Latescibacterota bacterium]|nr:MAG: VWA domain-containing protein [Candidatus Latescibacterota bacterium]